jgi:DNA (cytosine-5)-methyltransferase 1
VFVVGYLGDWRRAAAVLFDGTSLRGDSPPRRKAGERIAPTISSRPTGGGGLGTDFDLDGGLIANSGDVGYCLTASAQQSLDAETETLVAHALRGEGFDASEDGTGRGTPIVPVVAASLTRGAESAGKGGYAGRRQEDDSNLVAEPVAFNPKAGGNKTIGKSYLDDGTSYTLDTDCTSVAIAHAIQAGALRENPSSGPDGVGVQADIAYTVEARAEVQAVAFAENSRGELRLQGGDGAVAPQLTTGGGKPGQGQPCVAEAWAVRRLTPRECERLQGFPDDFTAIPYRGKAAADGPRYKALGNSMAVNVMRVIGTRIDMVDAMATQAAAAE